MRRAAILAAVCLVLFTGCARETDTAATEPPQHVTVSLVVDKPTTTPAATPEPTPPPDPWTAEEVEAVARVLSGECYEDKPHDKRLVAEVILNRVSNERWGDTVIEVVTQKSQFHGYSNPSRDVTENDREIATQALRDWYANDCAALSEYLFFEAGPNRENQFRENY